MKSCNNAEDESREKPTAQNQPTPISNDAGDLNVIYETLIEESTCGLAIIQNDRFVFVNRRITDRLGVSAERIYSLSIAEILEFIKDDYHEEIYDLLNSFNRGTIAGASLEVELTDSSDSLSWVELHGQAITYKSAPAISLTSTDITQRKLHEIALRESEKRLQLALECTGLGLWDHNLLTGEVFRSRQWAEMLGYTPEEIGENVSNWIDLVHPDDLPQVLQTARRHENGETDQFIVEHRLKTKDGRWKWVLNWGRTIATDDDGKPSRVLGGHLDITSRKKLEEIRAKNELFFRQVIDASAHEIVIRDRDTRIIFASQPFAQFYDLTSESIIGHFNLEFWHISGRTEEQIGQWRDEDRQVIETGENIEYVERLGYGRSRIAFYRVMKRRVISPHGIPYVLALYEDITEHELSLEALRESEERYRSLVNSSPSSIMVVQNSRYIFSNAAGANLLGYESEKDVLGMKVLDSIPEEYHGFIEQRAVMLKKGVPSPPDIIQMVRRDGSIIYVELVAVPISYHGQSAALVIGIDMTEQKIAQQELDNKRIELEQIFKVMPDAFVYADINRDIIYVNPAFERIFGYSFDEVMGRSASLTYAHEEDFLHQGNIRFNIDTIGKFDIYELKYKRKNGDIFIGETAATSVIDTDKKVTGFIGIIRDITRRKRAEIALRESAAFNRAIIKHSPLGISVRTNTGKLLSYNRAWKSIWLKSDEMISDDMNRERTELKFTRTDDYLKPWHDKVRKVYEQGGYFYLPETMFIHPDSGKTIWASQYFYAIKNSQGGVERVVILTEDITERKLSEILAAVSHKVLSISYKHSDMKKLLSELVTYIKKYMGCEAVGIRILDNRGRIPYQAYDGFPVTFYEKESPLNTRRSQCMCINVIKGDIDTSLPFYTDGGSFFMNATTKFLAGISEGVKGKTRNVCNKYGYESVALAPIKAGDQIVGLIHCADSHEYKISPDSVKVLEHIGIQLGPIIERIKALEDLSESEGKFRNLVESMNDGLLVVNSRRRFIYANKKVAAIFKTTREGIVGHLAGEFLDSQNRVILDKHWAKRKKGDCTPYEIEWRLKDGSTVSTIVSPTAIIGPNNEFGGSFSVITDITERKKWETFARIKSRLSDSIREAMEIDDCLKQGCQAVYDAHLFRHAVFVLGDSKDHITNLEYIGLDKKELVLIRTIPPSKPEELQTIWPTESKTGRIIIYNNGIKLSPQNEQNDTSNKSRSLDVDWQTGDRILIPLAEGIIQLHGWLMVDTPFKDAVIDTSCLNFIEDIVNTVVKRVNEVEFLRRLQHEHSLLEDKNITLREVLATIEKEKMEIKQQLTEKIDRSVLPLLTKLTNTDGSLNMTYLKLLSTTLKDILSAPGTKIPYYAKLSPREVEICDLIKAGASSKEIANRLHLSIATIQKHRERIRNKLGLAGQNINLITFLSNPE